MMYCKRCALGRKTTPVPGSGDPRSRFWLIGEAPGEEEERKGVPFVGKAGLELNNYLTRVGLSRQDFYITNVVKCRPPGNRDPKPDEIAACSVHLQAEMSKCPPGTVIGALGHIATRCLLGSEVGMEMVYGIPHRVGSIVVVPCYHPAAGLHDGRMMTQIMQGFTALADVIKSKSRPEDFADKYPEPTYRLVTSPLPLDKKATVVAIDTELDSEGNPLFIQYSTAPGTGNVIRVSDDQALRELKRYVRERIVVLHNAKFDLPILEALGFSLPAWYDTMLMAHLLGDLPRGLKALALRLAGMKMQTYDEVVSPALLNRIIQDARKVAEANLPEPPPVREIKDGQIRWRQPRSESWRAKKFLADLEKGKVPDPMERWPVKLPGLDAIDEGVAVEYAARDADATFRIFPILKERIVWSRQHKALTIDQAALPMIADMERTGFLVDRDYAKRLMATYRQEQDAILESIKDDIGYYVNPCSESQVGELLYKKLGLRAPKKTKKSRNPSTSKEALGALNHPIVEKILRYRELDKLCGSFLERILEMSANDGVVRDQINMVKTATGRPAASLLLTVPHHSPDAKALRNVFVARPGCVFLSFDYSQIELRVLAHMSGDRRMIAFFREGKDLHTETAALCFGVPVNEVTKEQRQAAKAVNFGIAYGITAKKLAEYTGWDEKTAQKFIDTWLDFFPGVRDFMQAVHRQAWRHGYVTDMFGRRRLIPEVRSYFGYIVEKGLRNAGNMPIQSTAVGIMKTAMGLLVPYYRSLRAKRKHVVPLVMIHDDLMWEVIEALADKVAPKIKAVMEGAVELKVPVTVDIKRGKRWGDME